MQLPIFPRRNRCQFYLIRIMLKKILNLINVKLAAWVGLAVLLVVGFALLETEILYRPLEPKVRGYKIDTGAQKQAAKKEEPVDFKAMLAKADAEAGAKIFKKCATCHTLGTNKVGPNLVGVIGRKRAAVPGFNYSDAMKAKGGNWDYESLNQYLTKPKDFIPGNKMAFAGLKKPQDRANVVKYLESAAKGK